MTSPTNTAWQARAQFIANKRQRETSFYTTEYSLNEMNDAIEILKAKSFIIDTKRNVWIPEAMKCDVENHIKNLCDVIESQKMQINRLADEHLKMRFEFGVQRELLSKVKEMKIDFERINTTPTMSKLTWQCIEAYNTCSEIQRKLLDVDKPKTKGKEEEE